MSLNKKALLELSNHLNTTEDRFNMRSNGDCIAGHGNRLFNISILPTTKFGEELADHLGMTAEQRMELFQSTVPARTIPLYTAQEAAHTVALFATTGVITWPS